MCSRQDGEYCSLVISPETTNWSFFTELIAELSAIVKISAPTTITGLLFYARNFISMIFLGRLGSAELAAGALSTGFANITGYSVLVGLASAMDSICGQAYGAQKWSLLSLTLHRTVIILLLTSFPISVLWLNVNRILLYLRQDPNITLMAKTYLLFSLPDLVAQSFLHPLRIYLRAQNINRAVAVCSTVASLIHIPVNYYFVIVLRSGIKGVAFSVSVSNFCLLAFLGIYIWLSGACRRTWRAPSVECFRDWRPFFSLAIPSCISVCLEWWWYEIMIILCGLLKNPEETVSAIGVLIQMTALVYVFPSSLSYAVSTRVGHELGAGRPKKAKWAANVGTLYGVGIGLSAMVLNLWASKWWGPIFTNNAGVLRLVSMALPVVGLCELGNCPQTAICGVLRGCARQNVGAHVNLAGFYVVGLPVALGLGFWMGLGFVGLWIGLLAAQMTCAAALTVVMVMTDWSKQASRAAQLTKGGQNEENKAILVVNGVENQNDNNLIKICAFISAL